MKEQDMLYILGDIVVRGPDGIKLLLDMMYRKNIVALRRNKMAKEEFKKANEKKNQRNNQGLKDKIYETAKSLFLEVYPREIEERKSLKNSSAFSELNRIFSAIAEEKGKKVDLDELHRIVSKEIFLKDICFRPEDNSTAVREIENASKGSIDANDIAVILSDGEYAPTEDCYTLWVLGIDKLYYVCDEKVELSYRYDEIEDIKWESHWGYIRIASIEDKEWYDKNVGGFAFATSALSGPRLLRDIIWAVIDVVKNYVEESESVQPKKSSDISVVKDIKFDEKDDSDSNI